MTEDVDEQLCLYSKGGGQRRYPLCGAAWGLGFLLGLWALS